MTKRELIILSAYTGYMLLPSGEFGLMAEASAEAIGRPIMTHEFADPNIQKAIREKLKPEVYKIIERAFGYVDFAEVALRADAAGVGCQTCKNQETDSYKYYTYPCNECKHRARDSYEPIQCSPEPGGEVEG